MRTAVIHQPDFLPHLAFFHRLLAADLFIVLDTAQFVRGTSRSWMNRDRIKTAGGVKWITIPVQDCPRETAIVDVFLDQRQNWRERHLRQIAESYRRASCFGEIYPRLQALYEGDETGLAQFNMQSIRLLLDLLRVNVEIVFASALDPQGRKNALLVDLLAKTGCDRYISGPGARAYFEPEPFEAAGIEVRWQEFNHPIYPQLHGSFEPYLSSIDVLLNCGAEESAKLLRSS